MWIEIKLRAISYTCSKKTHIVKCFYGSLNTPLTTVVNQTWRFYVTSPRLARSLKAFWQDSSLPCSMWSGVSSAAGHVEFQDVTIVPNGSWIDEFWVQPHVEFTHEFTHGFTPFGEWTSINQLYFSLHSQGLEENNHITHGVSLETDPASSPNRSWPPKKMPTCWRPGNRKYDGEVPSYHPGFPHLFDLFGVPVG